MSLIPTGGDFIFLLILKPLDVNLYKNARNVRFVLSGKNSLCLGHKWHGIRLRDNF